MLVLQGHGKLQRKSPKSINPAVKWADRSGDQTSSDNSPLYLSVSVTPSHTHMHTHTPLTPKALQGITGMEMPHFFFFNLAVACLSCCTLNLSCGMRDLVPWPRVEPRLPALGAWSLNQWTTSEVPCFCFLITIRFACPLSTFQLAAIYPKINCA